MDGRWHSRGRPVVYLAEHPAVALLENLVHLEIDLEDIPDTYKLIEIQFPVEIATDSIPEGIFDPDTPAWRSDFSITRFIGDEWLARGDTAILWVPSVILPRSKNALLNPIHPDAKLARIVAVTEPPYDRRLFHGLVGGL